MIKHNAPITISRAFDELETAGLARSQLLGRARQLFLNTGKKAVWSQAMPLLRSPVRQFHHIREDRAALLGLTAGLSAVAQLSALSNPRHATVAVGRDNWNSVRQQALVELIPMREEDTIDIEIWAYPPAILSDGGTVDPLSLYLAPKEMADERVEVALEKILEDLPW